MKSSAPLPANVIGQSLACGMLPKMFGRFIPLITTLALGCGLSACDNTSEAPPAHSANTLDVIETATADTQLVEALQHYKTAQIYAIDQVIECIDSFTAALNKNFLPNPTQSTLLNSQQAIQNCLDLYAPIHSLLKNTHNTTLVTLTESLYSAPILPGYVDYLLQYPNSGIVNDITVPLTSQSLRDQQGLTDSGEISLGFEVIAFLLFGEQRYNRSLAPRPASDYSIDSLKTAAPGKAENGPTNNKDKHSKRRRQYLSLAISLLQEDLLAVKSKLIQHQTEAETAASTEHKHLNQHTAIKAAKSILNTMLMNVQQQNLDSLSVGYWQLLKYHEQPEKTQNNPSPEPVPSPPSTLATYLKWPSTAPDLSREAFTAQLQASLQRLQ